MALLDLIKLSLVPSPSLLFIYLFLIIMVYEENSKGLENVVLYD